MEALTGQYKQTRSEKRAVNNAALRAKYNIGNRHKIEYITTRLSGTRGFLVAENEAVEQKLVSLQKFDRR